MADPAPVVVARAIWHHAASRVSRPKDVRRAQEEGAAVSNMDAVAADTLWAGRLDGADAALTVDVVAAAFLLDHPLAARALLDVQLHVPGDHRALY